MCVWRFPSDVGFEKETWIALRDGTRSATGRPMGGHKRTNEVMMAGDAVDNKALEARADLPSQRSRTALDLDNSLGLWLALLADKERIDDASRTRLTSRKDDDAPGVLGDPAVELGLDELDELLSPGAFGPELAPDASQ